MGSPPQPRTYTRVAAAIVVAAVIVAAAATLATSTNNTTVTKTVSEITTTTQTTTVTMVSTNSATPSTSSVASSSCSGSPPDGNCIATYSYTFTLSVNYSGPWTLTYQGYNSLGKSNPTNVSGSYNGTGFYSKPITLSGLDNNGLTLCAQAQKLDASSSTLILTVTGHNETSVPYGSASYCGGVAP
jgi:hypothetical protein